MSFFAGLILNEYLGYTLKNHFRHPRPCPGNHFFQILSKFYQIFFIFNLNFFRIKSQTSKFFIFFIFFRIKSQTSQQFWFSVNSCAIYVVFHGVFFALFIHSVIFWRHFLEFFLDFFSFFFSLKRCEFYPKLCNFYRILAGIGLLFGSLIVSYGR